MGLTSKQREEVERIKNNPFVKRDAGLSDEDILSQARFIENGVGIDIFDSEEEYRAYMKRKKI